MAVNGVLFDPTSARRIANDKSAPVEVARQFEAMLLQEITKHAVPRSLDGESGLASDTFGDMLAQQLAGAMAESGATGLAEMIAPRLGGPAAFGAAEVRRSIAAVNPRVTSAYGARVHPITGRPDFHEGVDVSLPIGTPLQAPKAGVVETIQRGRHGGLSVTLDHGDGMATTYRHLDSVEVREGERIEAGAVFARSGNSGRTTGPHLHLEVRTGGRHADPSAIIGGVLNGDAKDADR